MSGEVKHVELHFDDDVAEKSAGSMGGESVASVKDAVKTMATLKLTDKSDLRATHARVPLLYLGGMMRPSLFGNVAVQQHTSIEVAAKVYSKSFPTTMIDAFWSHSWRAPHWQKIIMLLLFYNGIPATIAGTIGAIVGLILAVLEYLPSMIESTSAVQADKDKEYGFFVWSTLFGIVVYLLTLVFWQSRRTIFLDKVCIHQTDDLLRRKGIESIGAYLKQCNSMLVLWDPTYVTRLWCVFELAAFLYAHQRDRNRTVICRPVILGPTTLTTFIIIGVEVMGILLLPADTIGFFVGGSSFVMLTLLVRLLRRYHRSLKMLRKDFRTFMVDRAGCFCCNEANHHLQGCTILCDRELVEGCIMTWFGSTEKFNQVVQQTLFNTFSTQLGKVAFPYHIMVLALVPSFWAFMDLAGSYWIAEEYDLALSQFCIGLALWIGALPTVFALTSTVAASNWVQKSRGAVLDWLIAAFCGAGCCSAVFVFSGSGLLSIEWLGPIGGTLGYIAIVVFISLGSFYLLGNASAKGSSAMDEADDVRATRLGTLAQMPGPVCTETRQLKLDMADNMDFPAVAKIRTVEVEWC